LTHAASESVRLLADRLLPHPVYVVNGLWDVLHANPAATRVFGDIDAQPGVTDNVLRHLFLDDVWQWREFVARLIPESADFSRGWSEHELATAFPREKVVRRRDAGDLTFLYASLAPDAEPGDVRMIADTPADASTIAKLATLVNAHATPNVPTVPETANGTGQRPRAVRGRSR